MMVGRRDVLRGVGGGMAAMAGMRERGVEAETPPRRVLVVGHRGASALRPEHTLASYAKAIADGADYVEGADLVPTKDGELIARHECEIGGTTDVGSRPEFAGRKRTVVIDGVEETGWFSFDFTLAEIRTLRARERLPAVRPGNTVYDGEFGVPTFAEIVEFVAAEAETRGREIGLIPELKSTPFLRSIGLPTEEVFLRVAGEHWYTRERPLVVQCFYADTLRRLKGRPGGVLPGMRALQLMGTADVALRAGDGNEGFGSYGEMMAPAGLRRVREFAELIGPDARSIIPRGADDRLGAPTTLVRDAHAAGLEVIPYTFRPENRFLAADFRDGAGEDARNPAGSVAEMQRYVREGIDGFFTDDPALGREAVDRTG